MKALIISLIIISLFSCKESNTVKINNSTINVNLDSLTIETPKLSKFFSSIEYIPLQTNRESAIANVDDIIYAILKSEWK